LEKFIQIETRKILHGFCGKREYFTRLVKLPHEYANDGISKPLKKVTINGKIVDASESIFTPCSYVINECNYEDSSEELGSLELLSYRGKFTEQATENDIVMVRGTLEEIVKPDETLHRIVLGGKGDYLIPIDS
jgi:predicted nucleotidyltransferase